MPHALRIFVLFLAISAAASTQQASETQSRRDDEVGRTVGRFESAVQNRDLSAIERLVSPDVVVFENGHRNNGWEDFRDHHLKPEFAEPAPAMNMKVVKVQSSEQMAWAYSQSSFKSSRRSAEYELWSAYVLNRVSSGWQIAMISWSIRRLDQSATTAAGPASNWSLTEIEKRLRETGLPVRRDTTIRQPFMSVPGTVFVLGDDELEVQAYVYPTEAKRARDTDKLDRRRVAPPTVSPA